MSVRVIRRFRCVQPFEAQKISSFQKQHMRTIPAEFQLSAHPRMSRWLLLSRRRGLSLGGGYVSTSIDNGFGVTARDRFRGGGRSAPKGRSRARGRSNWHKFYRNGKPVSFVSPVEFRIRLSGYVRESEAAHFPHPHTHEKQGSDEEAQTSARFDFDSVQSINFACFFFLYIPSASAFAFLPSNCAHPKSLLAAAAAAAAAALIGHIPRGPRLDGLHAGGCE